jgi:uncharacterized protein (DUF488 family)
MKRTRPEAARPAAEGAAVPAMFTIGHSTRPIGEFIELLRVFNVSLVVDVRTVPRSRHNPQFEREALSQALQQAGLGYAHFPGLGGLRHANRESPNAGWRNASFRGFADYMQTAAFADALEELMDLGNERRVVVMCAEAVPWRCHRSLIADALLVRGICAVHIISARGFKPHTLTPFARVQGRRLTYPAAAATAPATSPSQSS